MSSIRSLEFRAAFRLFERMLCSETRPNTFTSPAWPNYTLRVVHVKVVISFGLSLDFICNRTLLSRYLESGLFCEACRVFRRINEPDLFLWNAMILSLRLYGRAHDAF
ncbi:pentatricopeptide repeat-containing protein [Striga asiatica]|uniref:Pentatricopeptide repeat-containing protein n=1 Tax=Striga asiatica TaxID=4170 RepID=A0A5A7RHY9_STRAF|nr:pentatricopeptide repeat-containing protein [Striga asiatica]